MATRPQISSLAAKTTSAGILNYIMQNGGSSYFAGAPEANETDESIRNLGQFIMGYQPRRNAFVNALVNLIGYQIIVYNEYRNPWSWALRGNMATGETIEEVFVNPARPENYKANMTVDDFLKDRFGNRIPEILAAYHTINFQKKYAVKIYRNQLDRAFRSMDGVVGLLNYIVDSLYKGFEHDSFIMLKYVLHRTALDGKMKVAKVAGVDTKDNIEDTLQVIKKVSNDITFMVNGYTISREALTLTPIANQMDIISTDVDAAVSVKALAYAFNKEEMDFLGKRILVNEWTPYDLERLGELLRAKDTDPVVIPFTEDELATLKAIKAFVIDKDFLMQVDKVVEMEGGEGGENDMSYMYFLHHHAYFGASLFKNAIVFTTSTPVINSVTVSPATATLSAGAQLNMSADIETSGIVNADVIWSVGADDHATIDAYGLLTVNSDAQKGDRITVTAVSVADGSKSGTATITVA